MTPESSGVHLVASVLAHIPDALVLTGADLRVIDAAGQAERLFGWSCDALIGQPCPAIVAAEALDDASDDLARRIGADEAFDVPVRVRRMDGTWADVDLSMRPHLDVEGRRAGWLAIGRDVPPERSALRALQARERDMDAGLHAMADGVLILDSDARVVECNSAAERILGLTRGQIEGRTPLSPEWSCIHDDGAPYPGDTHPSMVAHLTGAPVRDAVMGVARPDGTFAWLVVNAIPLRQTDVLPCGVIVTFADITATKLAERREREVRERLEFVLEGTNDGFWDWHIPTGRVAFSERWCRMLGYTPSEVAPDVSAWEHLVHPDDIDAVERELQAHLRGDTPAYECEHRVRHKEGRWIWVLDRGKVVERDAQGGAIRAAGTHTDVTARKEAQLALVAREQQLQAFFRSPGVGVAFANLDGQFMRVNPQLSVMLGYTEEELLARTWRDVSHPDDLPAHPGPVRAMEAGEIDTFTIDQRYVRKDGTTLWALTSASCMRGPDGRITERVAIIKDITARKEAERALARSEAELQSYFESPAVGIAIIGADDQFVRANAKLCALLGYSAEELSTLTWHDVSHPDDLAAHMATVTAMLRGEIDSFSVDKRYVRKDATVVWAATSVSAIRDESGAIRQRVAIISDLTARKAAETAAEVRQRQLRESEGRLRGVVDAAAEAISLVDLRSGCVALANRRLCDILGLSAEEIVGRSALALADRIHPDDRDQLGEQLGGARSGHTISRSCEHRL